MSDKTKRFEGYTDKVFIEKGGRKGVRTVGSGINVEEKHNQKNLPADVVSGKRAITKEENDKAYNAAKAVASKDADDFLGGAKVDPQARAVIEDMSYNLGGPRMSKFKGLQKAVQSGDYGRAADELRYSNADRKDQETPYFKQTKGRAKEHYETLSALARQKKLGDEVARQIQ